MKTYHCFGYLIVLSGLYVSVGCSRSETPKKAVVTIDTTQMSPHRKEIGMLEPSIALLDTVDFSKYFHSLEGIGKWADLMHQFGRLIINTRYNSDSLVRAQSKKLNEALLPHLETGYPVARRNFAIIADEMAWQDDIEVDTYGKDHASIMFTGYSFALNKNIKSFHEKILPSLKRLRFESASYGTSGKREKFDFHPPKDTSLVMPGE